MNNKPYEFLGSGAGMILTALQTQQVFQIIGLILTIASTFFSISYAIYKWYKDAKKDGKIDKQEIDDLIDTIGTGAKVINSEVDDYKKSKGDKKDG